MSVPGPIPPERMAAATRTLLDEAAVTAAAHDQPWIGTEHLLLVLLDAPGGSTGRVFAEMGLSPFTLNTRLQQILLTRVPAATLHGSDTLDLLQALEIAVNEADQRNHFYVEPDHLLLALLADGTGSAEALDQLGVMRSSARAIVDRRFWEGE